MTQKTTTTIGVYTKAVMKRVLGMEMWYGLVIEVWPISNEQGETKTRENIVYKISGYSERWVKGKADQYLAREYTGNSET